MSSFCICKSYSHFFSKNNYELHTVLTRAVNILTTNELVKLTMLWKTGPWLSQSIPIFHFTQSTAFSSRLHVRPAKTQMSLRICAFWSVFEGYLCQKSKVYSGGQRILRSACAVTQADLSLRWAHMQSYRKCCAPFISLFCPQNIFKS